MSTPATTKSAPISTGTSAAFQFPAVYRLAVHLPREHMVYFNDDDSHAQIRDQMAAATSTLLAFLDYNRQHTDGHQYRYPDFPEHIVYKDHQWQPRKKGFAIGRMFQCRGGALLHAPAPDRPAGPEG